MTRSMLPGVVPQRVNPGGNLPPHEVIGRDEFIAEMWETLQRQSIVLTAERRIGKTSIVKKMRAEPRDGVGALYRSFEHVRSRSEFVDLLLADIRGDVPYLMSARRKVKGVLRDMGVRFDYGPVQAELPLRDDWKEVILKVFAALGDAGPIVFLWDEVPVMIGAVAENEGADAAHELLDVLRVVRQTCDQARMVFTGSIGLHHVVAGIQPVSYSRAPVNDMRPMVLGALSLDDAVRLTRNLFAGEGVRVASDSTVAEAVAAVTSCIPFYVQHVVKELSLHGGRVFGVADVERVVADALRSPVDPWDVRQYRHRIDKYYTSHRRLTLAVLDALAVATAALALDDILNRVRSAMDADAEDVRRLLELLQLDHYIEKTPDGYRFAFGIVGRAWRVQRDLA